MVRAFKAPSLEDQYVNFLPFFFGQSQPEARGKYRGGMSDLSNRSPMIKIRFGATYFRNDIRNLIESVPTAMPFVRTLDNVNVASTFGAETFASWTVSKYLNFRADYTYTVAKNDSTGPSCIEPTPCAGQQLLRRPKNKASLTTNWQATSKLSIATTILYVWQLVGREHRLYRTGQGAGLCDREYSQPIMRGPITSRSSASSTISSTSNTKTRSALSVPVLARTAASNSRWVERRARRRAPASRRRRDQARHHAAQVSHDRETSQTF